MQLEEPYQLSFTINSSVQVDLLLRREEKLFHLHNTRHPILVILVNQWIIMNFHSPPRGFSWFEFLRKNHVSPSIVCVVIIILHLHTKLILSLVVWIDRLMTRSEKPLLQ